MVSFRDRPLKTKLTAISMLTIATGLTLACTVFVVCQHFLTRQKLIDDLTILAKVMASNSTAALAFDDQRAAEEILRHLAPAPRIVSAALYSKDGRLFAHYLRAGEPADISPEVPIPQGYRFGKNSLELSRPIVLEGTTIGSVYVRSDLQILRDQSRITLGIMTLITAGAFFITFLLSSRLQRSISAPIRDLAQAAWVISNHQNYSIRVRGRSQDEVGMLIGSFNHMLQQIQQRDHELQRYREHLEEQVAARTQELACSNEQLRHEIIERLEAEASLERRNMELAEARDLALQATRLKSEFLANVSHEIRTPMNAVIGMTDLLQDTTLTTDQRECVDTIKQSGETLLAIIEDILDFSKMEAGKLALHPAEFCLRSTVEHVIDLFAAQAFQKRLVLACFIHPDIPDSLMGDFLRLRQILTNLVGNAIKFTECGEVVVEVHLADGERREARGERQDTIAPDLSSQPSSLMPRAPCQAGGEVLLHFAVRDTGIGIPPGALPLLFQSFSQVDGSLTRRFGGTGLGLAIAKRLTELMGGDIGVESAPGTGSTFWFTVKLELPHSHTPPPASRPLAGCRACVVEPETTSRMILEKYLTAWGAESVSVTRGFHALDLLRTAARRGEAFSVAIVSRHLTDLDGLALARMIRSDPALSHTKMLVLTSIGHGGKIPQATDAGVQAYLARPLRVTQLYTALTRLPGLQETAPEASTQRGSVQGLASVCSGQHNTTSLSTRLLVPEGHPRVLVAEDNAVNRLVAIRLLRNLGCQADVASTGQEAIEAIARTPYEVVLMDCQMPDIDGFETTRRIRACEHAEARRRVPIIAMTANAMHGTREVCLEAGMDDYLAKPVKEEELAVVLKRWLLPGAAGYGSSHSSTRPREALGDERSDCPVDPVALQRLRQRGPNEQEDFFRKVLDTFLGDLPRYLRAARHAIGRGEVRDLERALHSLKGSSGLVGAGTLARLCAEIVEIARTGTTAGAQERLDTIELEADRVRQALEEARGGSTTDTVERERPTS